MGGYGVLSYGFVAGAAGKVIAVANSTWAADFQSTSGTYVDVTNATLTISGLTAAKTYNLIALFTVCDIGVGAAATIFTKLLIDGTNVCETARGGTVSIPVTLTGYKQVTGATSYICKLQGHSDGSQTGHWNNNALTSPMTIIAVEV